MPTNLRVVNLTDTSVRFTWDAVSGATDYDVGYKKLGEKYKAIPHVGIATYCDLDGLTPNTQYRWVVKADRGNESSRWGSGGIFKTLPSTNIQPDPTRPPTSTSIQPDPTRPPTESFDITLRWEANYPPHLVQAVENAARKWETIITHGLQDGPVIRLDLLPGWEQPASRTDTLWVDDLVLVIRLAERKPAGWIHAFARHGPPRTERLFTKDIGLPIMGFVYMPNRAELFNPRNEFWKQYRAQETEWIALHEIGHILGLAPYPNNAASHPQTYAVWKAAAPSQIATGYVPVHDGHWHYEHPGTRRIIKTNSTMSKFRLTWTELYEGGHVDVPAWKRPSNYAEDSMITTLDAAALADRGYTVDMTQAVPLVVKLANRAEYLGKANSHAMLDESVDTFSH